MNKKFVRNLIILISVIAICSLAVMLFYGNNKNNNSDNLISCTILVKCDSLIGNESKLPENKRSLIPEDGILLSKKTLSVKDGETVFNLMVSEAKKANLQIDFSQAPIGGSVYIKGIGNFYEGDAGDLSGWTYKVNSESPSVGASDFVIKNGDEIEWIYSCDLLEDMK